MKGFDVDAPEIAAANTDAMPRRVGAVAEALKTAVVYPFFKRFCMSPAPFRHNDKCTACGLCAVSCPLGNISMSDGNPVWGRKCALCLRCYHICPSHAVAYGKETDGKGQKKVM